MPGARGVLVAFEKNAWDIDLDDGDKLKFKEELEQVDRWGWAEKFIVLEEVYDSPLYKSLKEGCLAGDD